MTKEEIKNSGIYYYNCPLCNEPFEYQEWEKETPHSCDIGFFECKDCNKKFYGSHMFENIVTVYDYEKPLFQAHDMTLGNEYKLRKMQYGRVASTVLEKKTKKQTIIANSITKEKDLLYLIRKEMNELPKKPENIYIDMNAYSILVKYLEYKTEPINTIDGIKVTPVHREDIDYFTFD